jgi:DNA processing protein
MGGEPRMALKLANTMTPFKEAVAYERLWMEPSASTKSVAEIFHNRKGLPSEVIEKELFDDVEEQIIKELEQRKGQFSIAVHNSYLYPKSLRQARYPIELFYYQGDIDLANSRSVSIVGTRKASGLGLRRARKLSAGLAQAGYTIISGLARGIDTAAHTAAIDAGGATIGVIGTPIDEYYPKENQELQRRIAEDFLLISQVPIYRYHQTPFPSRRVFFPERNVTMASLSLATIIVEASETSGTHSQARACMYQKKPLFILDSCFKIPGLRWPHKYMDAGAHRVKALDDIAKVLDSESSEKDTDRAVDSY